MKSTNVKFRRANEPSYLMIDSIIFDKFSPYALKVYGQLRKLTDYTKESDEAEITIKSLAALCSMSERQIYKVLNELEYSHFIIQRTNWEHFRYGKTNSFIVSRTYEFFKDEQTVQKSNTPAQYAVVVDNPVQSSTTPALCAVETALYAEGTAQNDIPFNSTHDLFQDLYQEVYISDSQKFILEKNLYLVDTQQKQAIFLREQCLKDNKAIAKHEELKTKGYDKTYEETLDECVSHYATQNPQQIVSPQRLLTWMKRNERYESTLVDKKNWKTKEQYDECKKETLDREQKSQQEKINEVACAPIFNTIVAQAEERKKMPKGFLKNMLKQRGCNLEENIRA